MSLFAKRCKIDGLKIIRPACSDNAEIVTRCAAEGAEPKYLLQQSGITRINAPSIEMVVDLGARRTFDAIILAKTNLTDLAQVKIEASDELTGLSAFGGSYLGYFDEISQANAGSSFPDLCDQSWPVNNAGPAAQSHFNTGIFNPFCDQQGCDLDYIACGYEPDIVWQAAAPVHGMRYVSIAIFDPGNSDGFIQASRLMIDQAWVGSCDVDAGWGVKVIDEAEQVRTRTGQAINACGARWREFDAVYSFGDGGKDLFAEEFRHGKSGDLFVIPPVENACDIQSYGFWAYPKSPTELKHVRCGNYSKAFGFTEVRGFVPCKKTPPELERILGDISLVGQDSDGVSHFEISSVLSPLLQSPTYSISRAPENGRATIDTVTGALTYTPDLEFEGAECFEVTATLPGGQQDAEEICVDVY